jgi:hypothetical protein
VQSLPIISCCFIGHAPHLPIHAVQFRVIHLENFLVPSAAGILSRVQQRVKARMARIRNVPEVILKESSDLLTMLMV